MHVARGCGETVDAQGLGPCDRKVLGVRVPSSAPLMTMISAITKTEDGTINLTVTIPWARVEETQKEVVEQLSKEVQLPGFRKGKAPKKLIEEKIDPEKVREEVLRKLLPQTYSEAVKEHNLNPILSPQIHVEKLDNDKDWQYMAVTCELPEVDLGDYKEEVKKLTAKGKIALPGKEPQPVPFEEISKSILESVKVTIPKIILDREVDRLLSQTLDEIKKLGLTLDQYLASTGKTTEILRKEYEAKAENDVKLEFALGKISDSEKISVSDEELTKTINEAKTPEEKKSLEANRYLLASIIRQRKTLEFLRNL